MTYTVSFSDISRATGISIPHLSRIYSGQRTPSLKLANKIASYLGIGLDDFYAEIRDIQRRKKESEAA